MVADNHNSCALCAQGRGCQRLYSLFGKAPVVAQGMGSAPNMQAIHWAYGLPMAIAVPMAVALSFVAQWASIAGFAFGLLAGFAALRYKFKT